MVPDEWHFHGSEYQEHSHIGHSSAAVEWKTFLLLKNKAGLGHLVRRLGQEKGVTGKRTTLTFLVICFWLKISHYAKLEKIQVYIRNKQKNSLPINQWSDINTVNILTYLFNLLPTPLYISCRILLYIALSFCTLTIFSDNSSIL